MNFGLNEAGVSGGEERTKDIHETYLPDFPRELYNKLKRSPLEWQAALLYWQDYSFYTVDDAVRYCIDQISDEEFVSYIEENRLEDIFGRRPNFYPTPRKIKIADDKVSITVGEFINSEGHEYSLAGDIVLQEVGKADAREKLAAYTAESLEQKIKTAFENLVGIERLAAESGVDIDEYSKTTGNIYIDQTRVIKNIILDLLEREEERRKELAEFKKNQHSLYS